jgi:hypothetical protein
MVRLLGAEEYNERNKKLLETWIQLRKSLIHTIKRGRKRKGIL